MRILAHQADWILWDVRKRCTVKGTAVIGVLLLLSFVNLSILWSCDSGFLFEESLPKTTGTKQQTVGRTTWHAARPPSPRIEIQDQHPIRGLMRDADASWEVHVRDRSKTFKEAVNKYRALYGRHPPPGFQQVRRLIIR